MSGSCCLLWLTPSSYGEGTDKTQSPPSNQNTQHASPLVIDATFASLRQGIRPTIQEIYQCEAEWGAYFREFNEAKSPPRDIHNLRARQVDCYKVMIKMALINFGQHGGWPFRVDFRFQIADELNQRAATSNDTLDHFCSIFPALITGDPDHAIRSFKSIRARDPFLTEVAAEWVLAHVPASAHKAEFISKTE